MSILEFREKVLQKWRERDPFLEDLEGFREFFNEECRKRCREEEKEADRMVEALAAEILRPVIVFPTPWAKDNPTWLLRRIRIDRLLNLMRGVGRNSLRGSWNPLGVSEGSSNLLRRGFGERGLRGNGG